MAEERRELVWVKGHSGVEGNELADRKARETVVVGRLLLKPDIVAPAGIRQAFPLHTRTKYDK